MDYKTASTAAIEEAMDKIRSQIGPVANELLSKIEKGVASGSIDNEKLGQLIATLEQLNASLPPR